MSSEASTFPFLGKLKLLSMVAITELEGKKLPKGRRWGVFTIITIVLRILLDLLNHSTSMVIQGDLIYSKAIWLL